MRGKMREGSASKAEAPQKIDDDQLSAIYVGRGAKGSVDAIYASLAWSPLNASFASLVPLTDG